MAASAPRNATAGWQLLKRSESWGFSIEDQSCTSQLQCVAIASRRGASFAVHLNGSGVDSVNRIQTRLVLGDISCTTSIDCQADVVSGSVTSGNEAARLYRTTDGGVRWTADARLPEPVIRGFGCSSPTHCLAIASAGVGLSSEAQAFLTETGGRTWTTASLPPLAPPYLDTIECGVGGGCLAYDRFAKSAVAITGNLGLTWTKVTAPNGGKVSAPASCTGASTCHVILLSASGSGSVWLWTIAQSNGRTVGVHKWGSFDSWEDQVSCPSSSTCAITAEASLGSSDRLWLTTNNGASWSSELLPAVLGLQAQVWCGTGGHCLATGSDPSLIAVRG
jgi:hypothetical protein